MNLQSLTEREQKFLDGIIDGYRKIHLLINEDEKKIEKMQKAKCFETASFLNSFYALKEECSKNIFILELIRKKEERFLKYLTHKYGKGMIDIHTLQYKIFE